MKMEEMRILMDDMEQDIKNVSGIGDSIFARIQENITV